MGCETSEIAGEVLPLGNVMREMGKVGMRDVGYARRGKCRTEEMHDYSPG